MEKNYELKETMAKTVMMVITVMTALLQNSKSKMDIGMCHTIMNAVGKN